MGAPGVSVTGSSRSRTNAKVLSVAPTPATRNAPRGELSAAIAPPSASPIPGQIAPIDSDCAHHPSVQVLRCEPLHGADQCRPLHAVADPADQPRHAGESQ